ncbi:MAG: M23 family metallopeptidase [Patescibacteria group bacterium]
MAVFLLPIIFLEAAQYGGTTPPAATKVGILGGVAARVQEVDAQPHIVAYSPVVPASPVSDKVNSDDNSSSEIFPASLADSGIPASQGFNRSDLITYKIQKGDTLYGIASYFGISLETLIEANPSVKARLIKPGDELNILPTSGIVYKTQDGDTLESIAAHFGIPESNISQFNKSINFGSLGVGASLIIPGGKKTAYSGSSLPDFKSQFMKPADGFNWGKLHPYNAVDIANTCGTPVHAAAEGLVIPDSSMGEGRGGWNGGYGNFVLIEHPFGDGVKTRYAHLKEVLVGIGDYVKQGDKIATMGDSGEATGCHVHFEVYGAENPFAK